MNFRPLPPLFIVFAALLGAPAYAAATEPRTATLDVTGHASITRPPDRTIVTLSVVNTDPQSARATSANAAGVNSITARMAQLGIAASALATTSYALSYYPRPSRPDPQSDQRYGFTVSRSITVTVDGTDRAGAIVDAAVAGGATSIDGVTFALRDRSAAVRAAQTAALADAQAQARDLAQAAGVRLVRILAIAPSSGDVTPPRPMMRMQLAVNQAVPTTIDPGALTVDATVALEYEIVPAR